jgi:menaquinone-dependent protoporphyrinogen IX oxidase
MAKLHERLAASLEFVHQYTEAISSKPSSLLSLILPYSEEVVPKSLTSFHLSPA